MDYKKIKKLFVERKNIIITTHKSPDGDALGSSLALYHSFKKNHKVKVIVPNDYPVCLKWLPSDDEVLNYELYKKKSDKLIHNADIIFYLDFNKIHRTLQMENSLSNSSAIKILIDHHEEPDIDCDFLISNSNISSTAELVYDFILKIDKTINKNIASCIYTGILTDTGSFKYPNVSSKTHEIISNLLNYKINHSDIHQKLFDSQSKSRFKLLNIFMNNLSYLNDDKIAFSFLYESDLKFCKFAKGDTEGFVNFPLSLSSVKFSAFFVQFEDGIKLSFRSQGKIDVNLFAKKYFNGGGHKNASGGFFPHRNLSEVLNLFKDKATKLKC